MILEIVILFGNLNKWKVLGNRLLWSFLEVILQGIKGCG